MSIEIVTYANKSQGMFEELVNNEFGVPVKVLGWGTEWKGIHGQDERCFKVPRKRRVIRTSSSFSTVSIRK
jgi:hypothetical protein